VVNKPPYKGYLIKEQIREAFKVKDEQGKSLMRDVSAWAHRCRIPEFTRLARTLFRYKDSIHNTLGGGPSNGWDGALNAQVNALTARARGFRSAAALMAMTDFVHGGLCPDSPYAQTSNRSLETGESRIILMSTMGRRSFLRGGLAAVFAVTAARADLAVGANPNRKMGTLSDTFPGTSLNGALWDSYGTVALAEGIVTLTDVAYTAQYSGIKSLALYDLTDSRLEAQLVSAGTQAASTQACLQVTDSGGTNSLTFMVTDGNLQAQQQVAGSYSTLASAAYSAASMAWLRIREAAGTTYFEYSADAETWTALWSGANPITETALHAVIQHGMRQADDPHTSSRWAMANPQAAVLLATTTGLTSLGPYNLQVNEYNSTAALDITSDGATGPAGFAVPVSALNVASGGAPGAGPSLYYGNHWGTVSADCRLPVAVSAITGGGAVTTGWSIDTSAVAASDLWDASYDVWFNASSSGNQSGDNASNLELMIWLNYSAGAIPTGVQVATGVSIAGLTWNVWYGTGGNGPCVSYVVSPTGSSITNLDLGLLAGDALARGYLSASWYLIDVEAGFELWSGGAGLKSKAFSVTVAMTTAVIPWLRNQH
jgi:Glycosyl hydrolase family 12/Transposase